MAKRNKAVVLGSNYYIGLSAIRCLGKEGVRVASVDYTKTGAYGAASKYCSERLVAPHYKEDARGFIDFLLDYGKKQQHPPVLIPAADPYVQVVDDYLDELREYYLLPRVEQGYFNRLMNKDTLYELMEARGILVPETVRLKDENFAARIREEIKFPCVVKPVDSHAFVKVFRRKVTRVANGQELEAALLQAKEANLEVVVQRIIPGPDTNKYTFDAYLNQDSRVTHCTSFHLLRLYPNNFGASVFTEHKYVEELSRLGKELLEGINYKGFAELEFKKDAETGKFYLMEINVRIVNFNNLLYKLGINIPYIMYKDLLGAKVAPLEIREDRNLVFWYFYEDVFAVKQYLKTGSLSAGEIFRSYFRPKTYAIWDPGDIKPSLAFLGVLGAKLWRRVKK